MEASALQAPARLSRGRVSLGSPLLRLRSDEQLVALFREGNDEAFRAIHDRYRQRLFAYSRQMLPNSRQDAEDATQDVFIRAYSALRANDRELALRAWLYRVAHNRCIDQLRRPAAAPAADLETAAAPISDPIALAEQRESLSQLIVDLQRLPEQQRSALLMRELSGMSYCELADALELSMPAVKSLLVRARVNLTQALEARETACTEIRAELVDCHDRGVRATATARRHMHDCVPCQEFRRELRGLSKQFSALTPGLGVAGVLAKLLGVGGGGGGSAAGAGGTGAGGAAVAGGTAAVAGGGAAAAGGAFGGGGTLAGAGFLTGTAGHMSALLAVLAAGGAVAVQPALSSTPARHPDRQHAVTRPTQIATSPPVSAPGAAGPAATSANADASYGSAYAGTTSSTGSTGTVGSTAAGAAGSTSVGLPATETLSGTGLQTGANPDLAAGSSTSSASGAGGAAPGAGTGQSAQAGSTGVPATVTLSGPASTSSVVTGVGSTGSTTLSKAVGGSLPAGSSTVSSAAGGSTSSTAVGGSPGSKASTRTGASSGAATQQSGASSSTATGTSAGSSASSSTPATASRATATGSAAGDGSSTSNTGSTGGGSSSGEATASNG